MKRRLKEKDGYASKALDRPIDELAPIDWAVIFQEIISACQPFSEGCRTVFGPSLDRTDRALDVSRGKRVPLAKAAYGAWPEEDEAVR